MRSPEGVKAPVALATLLFNINIQNTKMPPKVTEPCVTDCTGCLLWATPRWVWGALDTVPGFRELPAWTNKS